MSKLAKSLGYYIRQGEYQGTADNILGRWYVGREGHLFAPYGRGYRTKKAAWEAADYAARELGQ